MKSSTHLSISSSPSSTKQRKNTKYVPNGTITPAGTPSKNKNMRKFREKNIPEAQAFEKLVYDQLVDMLELLLKYNSGKTSHDSGILDKHLHGRAVESVDEGLSMITSKLEVMQGSSISHKATACSRLFAHLMRDLEHAVFSDDKQRLRAMRSDQQQSREEANRAQEHLTHSIARKDQNIAALETANAVLETRNQTLTRALELLQKELEKTSQSLTETHQKTVELRMQGWDFKAEVDRRGLKVLASVQSRMGFVPSGIQKQVEQLRILKPPGDPEYDQIRHQSTSRRGKSGKKGAASQRGFVSAASSPLGSFFAVSPSSAAYSSEQDHSTEHGPARSSIPFDKDNFRKFLQQTANDGSDKDAHSNYLARMDYLPQRGIAEHRRLSSTSSASGYTDRRSSTSSVGAATNSNGLEPLRASADSVLSGSPPRTQLSVSLRKPWAFDYLSDHEEGSDSQRDAPWTQKGANSTLSRVTSTAASIAVSASSDLLDDLVADDTLDREQDCDEEQEGRSEGEEAFSDGEEDDYLQNSALMEDISRQQALLSQQINLLKLRDDSAGASALRKAGTVSPQQKTRKALASPFRE